MLAQSEDDKPKRAENITEKAVRVQVPFAIKIKGYKGDMENG